MKQLLITGHLGQDAVVRQNTNNGEEFITFSVAVSERSRNALGELTEETTWFDCTTRQLNLAQYLTKGKKVLVQGRPKFEIYQSKQANEHRIACKISCQMVELLSSKSEQIDSNSNGQTKPETDDIPF